MPKIVPSLPCSEERGHTFVITRLVMRLRQNVITRLVRVIYFEAENTSGIW